MRMLIGALIVSLLSFPQIAFAQSALEKEIFDQIGSPTAIEIATQQMNVSEEVARSVSTDPAVPGPGMLDVDPLSRQGERYVYYETDNREMCRAVAATAAAAVVENYSGGEWLISTSCLVSRVDLTLNLDAGTASGKQWDSPEKYLWRGEWSL